jgi:hemoglobin
MKWSVIVPCLVLVMLSGASCQDIMGDDSDEDRQEPLNSGRNSLYERMGGETVLSKVIDDTIERARVDTTIDWSREGAPQEWKPTPENFQDFKRGLTRYVSEEIGGPQKYDGPDMRQAHQGMRITDEEFDAFMNHVRAALANNNVPEREQRELTRVFEKTRKQIVQEQDRRPDRDAQNSSSTSSSSSDRQGSGARGDDRVGNTGTSQ